MKGRDPTGNNFNISINNKLTTQQWFYNKVRKTEQPQKDPKQNVSSNTQDTTNVNGLKQEEMEMHEFSPTRIGANSKNQLHEINEMDEITEEDDQLKGNKSNHLNIAKQETNNAGLKYPMKGLSNKNLVNSEYRYPSYMSGSEILSEGDDLLTNNDELDSLMNPILYHRGIRSEYFFLIISGRVAICSGADGFMVEKGTFEFIGEQCLTDPEYIPDYSCKVLGNSKILRISRDDYLKAKLRDQK